MTLQLLWAEYVARHGERAYRYSRIPFCGRYREWRARQKRSLRQQHRAGDRRPSSTTVATTVPIVDRHTGEIRDAQVFVGVLGASSRYTYAEATHTQSLPDWIASHQRMLRFFGGVPELLVPDNLKAAVILFISTGPAELCSEDQQNWVRPRHGSVVTDAGGPLMAPASRSSVPTYSYKPSDDGRVVTWRRLATGRATWLCTRFPFHVDDDLPLGHINLHIGDSPRCLNTQYPGV